MRHRRSLLLAGLTVPLAAPALAQGEGYPSRPIRLLVGYPPAGTTDIAARLAAERLTPRLGQPVLVENRPGATGNIAAEIAARSEPDGHTLLTSNIATTAINYSLFGDRMPVKPGDFTALGLLTKVPNLIFVHPSAPVRNVAELVALAKARPGALNYGSAGSGGSPHMTMEMFKVRTGTNINHVPFRGAGPMLIEAVAGRLDCGCDNMPSVIGHVRDGRLRPIAVTSRGRAAVLPDVPSLHEAGLTDFEATAWFGLQAPARTPPAVVQRLGREIDAITRDPGYRARLAELGGAPPGLTEGGGTSPESYERFITEEIRRWAEVVQASGAKID
jgi:tripartite-type tricarboxylate transporter receptor subunit TctC